MGPRPGMGGVMRPMVEPAANAADADQTSPQQAGKNRAQQERYAGLSPSERRTRVWSDIVKWARGRPIYWFARSLDLVDNALPVGGAYENIAEVDAPAMGAWVDRAPGWVRWWPAAPACPAAAEEVECRDEISGRWPDPDSIFLPACQDAARVSTSTRPQRNCAW
ncbi:MAG: hypothetical protein HY736_11700 [Verrucomicrobia bacterium]|nr:hypothetical protein [Verrucomicrobiota bacterium]